MLFKELKGQIWAILWSVLIFFLCNLKLSDSLAESSFFFDGFDKLVHTIFFFVLAVLLFYGRSKAAKNYKFSIGTIVKVILICVFIGGSIELLQWKVFTYRGAEWWDFASDLIGTGMAVFSYVIIHASQFQNNNHLNSKSPIRD